MQTFMPYPNFKKTARILDYRRLGKQRSEALDIYRIITGFNAGASEKYMAFLKRRYKNHPAVNMWRGYEKALLVYAATMCIEWIRRGYKDTTYNKVKAELDKWKLHKFTYPEWVGNNSFHEAHMSKLIWKNSNYVSIFGDKPVNLPYFWPTKAQ